MNYDEAQGRLANARLITAMILNVNIVDRTPGRSPNTPTMRLVLCATRNPERADKSWLGPIASGEQIRSACHRLHCNERNPRTAMIAKNQRGLPG
jgi:hypothetical protein